MSDTSVNAAGSTAASDLPAIPDSGNSGFVVLRSGQLRHEHRREGRAFAVEMAEYFTRATGGRASLRAFEEIFGQTDRIHWIQSWRNPNDYAVALDMSDHDESFHDITQRDRLAEAGTGKGNWENMFVEATYNERVLVPQHGMGERGGDGPILGQNVPPGYFVEPAVRQVDLPVAEQITSAQAGVIAIRSAQCRYAFRGEARWFAEEWARSVNQALEKRITVYLYEETFGRQDRIYWMIHGRSVEDLMAVAELAAVDADHRKVLEAQRISEARGGGDWTRTFVDGSIKETVLRPLVADRFPQV